ncbi:MAG: 1-acyl-sn-glycerol-3-phosphate acyltransferase [Clostridia bacterium]|nr:1-acyl-sn-glycerol-3-phosphate acyltransferase [Clostridia bacterium]
MKTTKFKKPSGIVLFFAYLILSLYFKIGYGLKTDRKAFRGLKGPSMIIAPHLSMADPFLVALAVYPLKPTFVTSAHFFGNPVLKKLLSLIHPIRKTMFSSDAGAIMNIYRAAAAGCNIVMFPEGKQNCFGKTMKVTDGTAELIRRLKIPVYCVDIAGAHLSFPKWGKYSRHGKIRMTARNILTADQIKMMSTEQIHEAVSNAIRHDDEAAMDGITYSCRDMTLGADGLIYKCPECLSEYKLTAKDGHINCTCGMDATLDNRNRLSGVRFKTIDEWHMWQIDTTDTDTELKSEVIVGAFDANGVLQKSAGVGYCTLNKDRFTFDGNVFGKETSFTVDTSRISGLPITVGKWFDVAHENAVYNFSPMPDPRKTISWVTFIDKLHNNLT